MHTCRLERGEENVTSITQLDTVVEIGKNRATVKPPAQALETRATLEQDPVPPVITGAIVNGEAVEVARVVVPLGCGAVVTIDSDANSNS